MRQTHNPNNHLLYYPSFIPPSRSWAQNTLLFWDELSSIVPQQHEQEVDRDYINELRSLEVYRPIDPKASLEVHWQSGQDIAIELLRRINTPEMQRALVNCPREDAYHISVAKVTYEAGEILRGALVAADPDQHSFPIDQWVAVKRPAALLYMSLLADQVAKVERVQPGTDELTFEDSLFSPITDGPLRPTVRVALEQVLPAVREDVSFEAILRFKAKHREQLMAFRTTMDELQGNLVMAASVGEACAATAAFETKFQKAALQFDRLMVTERLKGITGNASALLSVNEPSIVGALVGLGIGASAGPGIALMSASAGFVAGGCIKVAERMVAARKRADKQVDLPMSYVFQAAREL